MSTLTGAFLYGETMDEKKKETARKAVRYIYRYCRRTARCVGCLFTDRDNRCRLGTSPYQWQLEDEEK